LLDEGNREAYLQVSDLAGLQLVPVESRDPYRASSAAVGQAMRHCYDKHSVRKFIIGSGGSAFTDGGFGAVQALKVFDFLDETGDRIEEMNGTQSQYATFDQVDKVKALRVIDKDFIETVSIVMPSDVQSPMLGSRGAAYVFGP
jgi:glycerate 2-kinase